MENEDVGDYSLMLVVLFVCVSKLNERSLYEYYFICLPILFRR